MTSPQEQSSGIAQVHKAILQMDELMGFFRMEDSETFRNIPAR
jgi:hypothetical protein